MTPGSRPYTSTVMANHCQEDQNSPNPHTHTHIYCKMHALFLGLSTHVYVIIIFGLSFTVSGGHQKAAVTTARGQSLTVFQQFPCRKKKRQRAVSWSLLRDTLVSVYQMCLCFVCAEGATRQGTDLFKLMVNDDGKSSRC